MSTFTRPIAASFGIAHTGLAANMTYRVRSAAGADLIAATGAGITEDPAGSGIYKAAPTWDRAWGVVNVDWIDSTDSLYASEQLAPLPTVDSTGGVAVASVASDAVDQIAAGVAAPNADAIVAGIMGETIDGTITFEQKQVLDLAIIEGRYTIAPRVSITAPQVTTYFRNDGTTVLATSTVTFNSSGQPVQRTFVFSNLP